MNRFLRSFEAETALGYLILAAMFGLIVIACTNPHLFIGATR